MWFFLLTHCILCSVGGKTPARINQAAIHGCGQTAHAEQGQGLGPRRICRPLVGVSEARLLVTKLSVFVCFGSFPLSFCAISSVLQLYLRSSGKSSGLCSMQQCATLTVLGTHLSPCSCNDRLSFVSTTKRTPRGRAGDGSEHKMGDVAQGPTGRRIFVRMILRIA